MDAREELRATFRSLPISALKEALQARGIDTRTVVEKDELVNLLIEADLGGQVGLADSSLLQTRFAKSRPWWMRFIKPF
jgi:hypothetical protein